MQRLFPGGTYSDVSRSPDRSADALVAGRPKGALPVSLKRSIAHLMRRVPFLYPLIRRSFSIIAARFTVGVTGIVFNRQGEILLLEHVYRDRHPWGPPGGWVGRRERPQDALRRELLEEVGLAVRVGSPVLVELDGPPGHMEIGFLCEVEGEIDHLSDEILSIRWVSPDALPESVYELDRELIRRAQALRSRQMDQKNEKESPCRGEGGKP